MRTSGKKAPYKRNKKGTKILIVSAVVVLLWGLLTIFASFHAIHHDHAVAPSAQAPLTSNSSQTIREQQIQQGGAVSQSLSTGDRSRILSNNDNQGQLLPSNNGLSPVMISRGGARATIADILKTRQDRNGESNNDANVASSAMKLQPQNQKRDISQKGLQPPGRGMVQQVNTEPLPINYDSSNDTASWSIRRTVQQPRSRFRKRMSGHLGGMFSARAGSFSRVVNIEPKQYDSKVLQTQSTICVERNLTTNLCSLHPCHTGNITRDDYGFVLHQNNTRGESMMTAGHAAAGSGCAISHKYKFVYIHVLKSGGTTMKGFLKRGLCGGPKSGPPQTCPGILEIVNCGQAVYDHPHYFTFSFVRNPFDRIYSAYSMADSMKGRHQQGKSIDFEDFVFMDRNQRRRISLTSPSHYLPQVRFLFDSARCPVVDYLGRLERFASDLQVILKHIQSPELQAYFDAQQQKQDVSSNISASLSVRENSTSFGERKKQKELGGKLSNAYRSQPVVTAVAREFGVDFRLLQYNDTKIP